MYTQNLAGASAEVAERGRNSLFLQQQIYSKTI